MTIVSMFVNPEFNCCVKAARHWPMFWNMHTAQNLTPYIHEGPYPLYCDDDGVNDINNNNNTILY